MSLSLQEAKRTDPSLVIYELEHGFTLLKFKSSSTAASAPGQAGEQEKVWAALGRALQQQQASSSTPDASVEKASLHASGHGWLTVTRTVEELSVLAEEQVARGLGEEAWEREEGWACLRVRGPMELNLTGIAADFTRSLQRAEVAVFVISTWNTDWIFIKRHSLDTACRALAEDGWKVERL